MGWKEIDKAVIDTELEEETPRAKPYMKGLSPLTHLRKYLKEKKAKKTRDTTASEGSMRKGGSVMIKTKLGKNKPCKLY
tara:strand:+ start:303 stop:539 length:237 start_codon:yes stop_codon:yes gene_type:complete